MPEIAPIQAGRLISSAISCWAPTQHCIPAPVAKYRLVELAEHSGRITL